MASAILVLNAGSSSLKFSAFLSRGAELETRIHSLGSAAGVLGGFSDPGSNGRMLARTRGIVATLNVIEQRSVRSIYD